MFPLSKKQLFGTNLSITWLSSSFYDLVTKTSSYPDDKKDHLLISVERLDMIGSVLNDSTFVGNNLFVSHGPPFYSRSFLSPLIPYLFCSMTSTVLFGILVVRKKDGHKINKLEIRFEIRKIIFLNVYFWIHFAKNLNNELQ